MMLFRNHKKGFMMIEVVISLAVIGILLTAILQLQLAVSQRIIFNTQTCHNFLELKKDLYHSFIAEEGEKKEEQKSVSKKISIATLDKYKRIAACKINKTWQVLRHTKDVEFLFLNVAPEKKDEK